MSTEDTNLAKQKAFDDVLKKVSSEIKTNTGGKAISRLSDVPQGIEKISSGSLVFDSILGGGFPRGRLIELYGPEASGKTSFALNAAAEVQRNGGTVAFIDVEQAFSADYAATLGVDIDSLGFSQPDYAEQALNIVMKLTESGVVDLIIVDSIAALTPKAELEGDMEDHTIGLLARLMGKALRKITPAANKTGTTIIFINQVRDAVGQFSPMGTPQTTPGGKAMKFFASQRVEVKRRGQIKEGGEVVGNEIRLKVIKNKVGRPYLTGTTLLTFSKGINLANEIMEVGADLGILERPNNRTYIHAGTGEILGKSRAEALERIETDPEVLESLKVLLSDKLNKRLEDGTSVNETLVKEEGESTEGDELEA